jgi:hypothetical protein
MTAVHLDGASIEAIAQRVADLLRGEDMAGELIDTAEVARRFGVSRDWVYANADRIGAVRMGDGPKARLRFDPERVREALAAQGTVSAGNGSERPRRRRRSVDLLPVRGGSAQ